MPLGEHALSAPDKKCIRTGPSQTNQTPVEFLIFRHLSVLCWAYASLLVLTELYET